MAEQLTLGELIRKLEPLVAVERPEYATDPKVRLDFEYAYPVDLGSWRGVYADLAISFTFGGYGMPGFREIDGYYKKPPPKTLVEFIKMLKWAIGQAYPGWKGGEFVMDESTPLWVANDGNSGNTAVVGVRDNEYEIVLLTAYHEYTG